MGATVLLSRKSKSSYKGEELLRFVYQERLAMKNTEMPSMAAAFHSRRHKTVMYTAQLIRPSQL